MLDQRESRKPTLEEYTGLLIAYEHKYDVGTVGSKDIIDIGSNSMLSASIAIWDHYMPDSPGMSGRIAVTVYGECSFIDVWHWNVPARKWEPVKIELPTIDME